MEDKDEIKINKNVIIIVAIGVIALIVFLTTSNKNNIQPENNTSSTQEVSPVNNGTSSTTTTYAPNAENQSIETRQEIVNEKQILVNQLVQNENNSQNGQQYAYYKSLVDKGLSDMSKINNQQMNSPGGLLDPNLVAQGTGISSEIESYEKMEALYQNAVNNDLQIGYKTLETNFCDLNPKITTDSNRTFCHSLFK